MYLNNFKQKKYRILEFQVIFYFIISSIYKVNKLIMSYESFYIIPPKIGRSERVVRRFIVHILISMQKQVMIVTKMMILSDLIESLKKLKNEHFYIWLKNL